jgi:hypothetical protein
MAEPHDDSSPDADASAERSRRRTAPSSGEPKLPKSGKRTASVRKRESTDEHPEITARIISQEAEMSESPEAHTSDLPINGVRAADNVQETSAVPVVEDQPD